MIWDEPFNAIDINRKFPWYQEVAAFVKQNTATFCFSTHDIDEALILADCVRIFDLGMKQVDEITMDENAPRSFKSLASEAITKQSVQIRQSLKGFQSTRTSI
jgi:ABC-type nitrate/sulfonate/bicarbonate transport system ATPase subunit